MAKACSSIEGFVPAYGTIIVVPEVRSKTTETVVLQIGDQTLPRGRVVAIGDVPRRYRKVPIGIGSLIAYSKIVTQSVPVEIDGVMTNVMCVMWSDYRMCWTDKNVSHEISIRDIFVFGAGVATGVAISFRKYWLPFAKAFVFVRNAFKRKTSGQDDERVH